jgi:hypothetical protein
VTRWRLAAVAVLVGVLGAGCGSSTEPAAVAPKAGEAPKVQLALTPGPGKPIVTFEGLVNGGKPIAVDLASFDALPKQSLTIMEPFVKKSMTFTGVGFGDLLTAAKATGKSVNIHAVDDFEATLSVAVLREAGVLLATRADGKLMEVKSGGPVRLVFPPTSEAGKDTNNWVWSIDQITVR